MSNSAPIAEIFTSIQGEGKFVGARQIFVRLSGCPLNCYYCDTDHTAKEAFYIENISYPNPITPNTFANIIRMNYKADQFHSLTFTGGEPLLYTNFIRGCALLVRQGGVRFFLETSGYDVERLVDMGPYFDYMSIDLKDREDFIPHTDNLLTALKKMPSSWYLKLALDESRGDELVRMSVEVLKKHGIKEIWLQPIHNVYLPALTEKWQLEFVQAGISAYFVPQVHKLLGIR
jgi:organic radical activating enzyme